MLSIPTEAIRQATPEVQIKMGIVEEARPFFFQNGYSRGELDQFQSWGAKTFIHYQAGSLAAACFIYPNYGQIWEIAGVRTLEAFRGRGLAKQLVKAAVRYLLDQGYTCRYQLESENVASQHLAESIGMVKFLDLGHYVAYPKGEGVVE